jgi:hypothetical protein
LVKRKSSINFMRTLVLKAERLMKKYAKDARCVLSDRMINLISVCFSLCSKLFWHLGNQCFRFFFVNQNLKKLVPTIDVAGVERHNINRLKMMSIRSIEVHCTIETKSGNFNHFWRVKTTRQVGDLTTKPLL